MSSKSISVQPLSAKVLDQIVPTGFESPASPLIASSSLPPEAVRELVSLVGDAKQAIFDALDSESDLGASPENETAALLQAWLAENATERAHVEGLGGEIPLDERDLRWGLSLLSWLRGLKKHPILRPTKGPEQLPAHARIALLGDWGSGRYSAPKVGQAVAAGSYDVAIHLGDVYYAGTEREVRDNFLRYWPVRDGMLSRALNSNHEMYSGGYGYFKLTLPRFEQEASYFALRNDHFLLIGLDTGYDDHNLDDEQLGWLKATVAEAGGRKVILMSHHQLYKPGDAPAKKLVAKVGPLLEAGKIFAWYWGHEHVAAIFDHDPTYRFHARCIGHGGFPYFRYSGDAPSSSGLLDSSWRTLAGNNKTPNALQLDDPNPDVAPADPKKYGAQGFASLELDGPSLVERLHRPDGSVIYEKKLA